MADQTLYERARRLLEPGEIELDGIVVETGIEGPDDVEMQQATLEVGDAIADAAGYDPVETYVYSGNDDPEFASNQHQGLTLADDEFVWECQQLLRDGTYDLVFYYEKGADNEAIAETVEGSLDADVTVVEG